MSRSSARVPLGAGQAEDWSFADFAGIVNIGGVVGRQPDRRHRQPHVGQRSRASTRRSRSQSYLTVYPSDAARPDVVEPQHVEGPPVPNMAIVKYSADDDGAGVQLRRASAHYLFDAAAVVLAD